MGIKRFKKQSILVLRKKTTQSGVREGGGRHSRESNIGRVKERIDIDDGK